MTNPQPDTASHEIHLSSALDHARSLAAARPDGRYTPAWLAQAAQVGDLTVLALAMRS